MRTNNFEPEFIQNYLLILAFRKQVQDEDAEFRGRLKKIQQPPVLNKDNEAGFENRKEIIFEYFL